MIGRACFLPFCFWARVLRSEHLHFRGYFLPVVDSRRFRIMLQILLELVWPSNEIAIRVPSTLSTPGWRSAFCCMVAGRENLFLLSQIGENHGFMTCVAAPRSQNLSARQCSTLCLSPRAEGYEEPFTYECKREFQEEKLHQFWVCFCQEKLHNEKRQPTLECTSITAMSMRSVCLLLPPRTVPWCDFWMAL